MKKKSIILIAMKVSIFLLFVCVFSTHAINVESQTAKVNINGNNLTIGSFIEQVEKQTNYLFVYSKNEINTGKSISIKSGRKPVNEFLYEAFNNSAIKYSFDDDYVILTTKSNTAINLQPNEKVIKGKVSDEAGEPIIGANVVQKGTSNGTITDVNGDFSLTVSNNSVLVISFIGYKTQEISVQNRSKFDISMVNDSKSLDEIVVVGYGTQKKSDLTGAISSVKFDDEPINSFSSISQALAGKAAGMQVTTISAQPGGSTQFAIRGAGSINAGNSPLIIIDGFPVSGLGEQGSGNRYDGGPKDNALATLNPNDIESISILKDASATAIYGSRAGHGVIIVTTKRGKEGKINVQYSGNIVFQNIANKVKALNARQFMEQANLYAKERYLLDNQMAPYGTNVTPTKPYRMDLYTEEEMANPVNDTDWYGAITRKGFQQQHSISLNGGNENLKFLASLNYLDQQGVIKSNDMERINGRINLDQKLGKYINTGLSLTYNRNSFNNVPLGSKSNEYSGLIRSAVFFSPLLPIKEEDGSYALNPKGPLFPNPVSLLEITDKSVLERLLATGYIEIVPIKDLKVKFSGGIDRNYSKRTTYLPKTTLYGKKANGQANINQADKNDYLFESTISYNKSLGLHNIAGTAGFSYQEFNGEGVGAGNQDFIIDGFLYNNLWAGNYEKPSVTSYSTKSSVESIFARATYNYDNKYYLTGTIRADGASNLAKGHKWGYFPSVSAAWRISQEHFMEGLRGVLTDSKIRVGYGETGNSNVGNKSMDFFGLSGHGKYIFGGSEYKPVGLSQIGNPELKWETTSELNFGLDVELFGRINISAEYYNRVISDLLNTRMLMSYQEVPSIAANIGKTQSKGYEITINSRNILTKDFSWISELTLSHYKDTWKERDPSWKPNPYETYHADLRAWYSYRSDGIVQPGEKIPHMPGAIPGQIKIKDIDGFQTDENGAILIDEKTGLPLRTGEPDGKISNADIQYVGNGDPSIIYGLNNTIKWKNFDLNVYIYGNAGRLVNSDYKTSSIGNYQNLIINENKVDGITDAWYSGNMTSKNMGFFQSMSSYGAGDYYFKKIWFARLRNITLGYTLPSKLLRNVVRSMRVSLDLNNLFVLTNYKGIDPETDSWVGGYLAYPNVRSYSLGVNITF